jgi:hypothetical protein
MSQCMMFPSEQASKAAEHIVKLLAERGVPVDTTVCEWQLADIIDREFAEIVKKERCDDPELDATDFAHPAWWRGNDAGCAAIVRRIEEILEGKDTGAGVCGYVPLEALRRKILAMKSQIDFFLLMTEDDMK